MNYGKIEQDTERADRNFELIKKNFLIKLLGKLFLNKSDQIKKKT